jgi:N-acetyl sugar amidotransferase
MMPDTKPDLYLDEEGVCSACRYYEQRVEIDWEERKEQLREVLEKYRSKDGSNYDCIVPVSGGKDSTWQVITMLELGMNPLCVVATTCDLSELGRKNLDNIKKLGVDCIEYTTNPEVRAKLNRIGLKQVGDISWPEHVNIFTVPVRIAVKLRIPLLIWGENPQSEYGGPAVNAQGNVLDRRWLEEFGGMLGLRVADMIGLEGLTAKDMIAFTYPTDEELREVGVTGLFLGYFLPWDGFINALVSEAYGFTPYSKLVEGSMVNYENLDNHQTGIHDYFKYLKFGFSRTTDISSLHVRRGRLTRDQAKVLIEKYDGKFPWTYLGKPIEQILEPLDMTVEEFIDICDRFTNKKIFVTDSKGNLVKDKHGNLKKTNYDNV